MSFSLQRILNLFKFLSLFPFQIVDLCFEPIHTLRMMSIVSTTLLPNLFDLFNDVNFGILKGLIKVKLIFRF